MKFSIRKQRYPNWRGERPLSYGIFYGRTFLVYSWTFSGAWVALQVIKETMQKGRNDASNL